MTKGGDGEEHVCVNSGTGGTSHLGDSFPFSVGTQAVAQPVWARAAGT